MAKTIISKGISKFRAHCDQCDCTFEYEMSDVQHDRIYTHPYVTCPSCSHTMTHFDASGGSSDCILLGGHLWGGE
jgi:hypothetical protein